VRRASRRNSIGEQFAPRTIRMLRCPAYSVLSLSGRRVLDRIEIEMADHGGTDNGKLPVTYDDFERYGIHRHCIGPAIREVVALGFVEITEHGRAGNAEWRRPHLFRLTYRPTKYEPTNEWEKVKTPKRPRLSLKPRGHRGGLRKTNPSGEKRQFLVAENVTTWTKSKVRKPALHPTVRKSPLLSIFRGGEPPAQKGRAAVH